MKRIINSPLKILGLLTVIFGLLGVLTFSYFFFVGIYLVGIGLLIFLIDFLALKLLKNIKTYWITQSVLATTYIIIAFVTYMKWQEHNYLIFPKEFKGQAGIIFGIEGYPELPKTKFWKKTINIPADGIIITSTKVEDIPNSIRFAYSDNSKVDYQDINWEPNFEIDCIVCDSKIKSWLFQVDNQSSTVKEIMTSMLFVMFRRASRSLDKEDFQSSTTLFPIPVKKISKKQPTLPLIVMFRRALCSS